MRAGNWLAWDLIKRIFDTKVGYTKNFVYYEEKDEIIPKYPDAFFERLIRETIDDQYRIFSCLLRK